MKNNQIDKKKIESLLPHREPMLLIDKLINIVHLKSATAIMNVKKDGFYVQGHFPGQPVMPGVLIVEAFGQAAAALTACGIDPKEYDKKSLKKIKKDGLDKICSEIISLCHSLEKPDSLVENLNLWGDENGIGAGQIMMTARTILVGGLRGVDLQKIVSFVGLEAVSKRTVAFLKMNI